MAQLHKIKLGKLTSKRCGCGGLSAVRVRPSRPRSAGSRYCVVKKGRTVSCHRTKKLALAAKRKARGGRVVKRSAPKRKK